MGGHGTFWIFAAPSQNSSIDEGLWLDWSLVSIDSNLDIVQNAWHFQLYRVVKREPYQISKKINTQIRKQIGKYNPIYKPTM